MVFYEMKLLQAIGYSRIHDYSHTYFENDTTQNTRFSSYYHEWFKKTLFNQLQKNKLTLFFIKNYHNCHLNKEV